MVNKSPTKSRRQNRKAAYRRGLRAETFAALLLMTRGYRVLARRFRTPLGEIDLIVRRGRRIAFIEVKRRGSREEALAAVTPRQQARIRKAAALWLAAHPPAADAEIGFDIVVLSRRRLPLHLVDALPHLTY